MLVFANLNRQNKPQFKSVLHLRQLLLCFTTTLIQAVSGLHELLNTPHKNALQQPYSLFSRTLILWLCLLLTVQSET